MPAPASRTSAFSFALSMALLLCVAMGSAVAQARFRVMTATELRFAGSWVPSGPDEFAARMPMLLIFGAVLTLAVGLLYRLVLRRFSAVTLAFLCVGASLILTAQQTYSVRAARGQRMAFLRTMHRIEGAAAPGEAVIVESPDLFLQLRWYAGSGFRQQLTDRVTERSRVKSEEALFVGRRTEKTGRELKDAGFALHEDEMTTEAAETLRRLAGEGTRVYFVTADSAAQ